MSESDILWKSDMARNNDKAGRGFGEDAAAPFDAGRPRLSMRLTMGGDGRLLIPAELRDAVGIERGAVVIAEVEDGRLVLESYDARIDRLQARLAKYKRPGESVVDEFIAEKRAEAARE
jgi:bifunctional DNA-binding transcriptional regulator/antitoxin component of YhaV-PrlF toxin-antitoxin module